MQRFFNSAFGVRLGLALGRLIPPEIGYRVSAFAARRLARRSDSPMVQAVRANQAVIRGEQCTPADLDRAVEQVFTHAGRCFVDLYQNIQDPLGLKARNRLTPDVEKLIHWSHDPDFGAFVVAPHLSNFDLVLLALAYRGMKGQVLTYGNPTGGYKIQNALRAETGLDITPVCASAHRQALRNLKSGGLVITAVDRPIREKAHTLHFFGRPSPLPAGHIRLALRAGVPIVVVAAEWVETGEYIAHISDPIPLVHRDDPDEAIRVNGEAVLSVFEGHIRRNPAQWLMYYPVWPEA